MLQTLGRLLPYRPLVWVVVCLMPMSISARGAEPNSAEAWETIRPDFSNVRGLNYIASYAPSDVAMWRFYDHDQIDRELGMIKGMGANSLRVWLAWVVYDVEGDKFIGKFEDFLSLCEKHRITVMPILWDSCFGDELASYDDVKDWVANPGTKRVADASFRKSGDEYVRAVVAAGSDNPSLLAWDIMNEPSGPKVNEWLKHYCHLVKAADPKHPVTIGWAHASSNAISADWVDVMSYHPYGIFDKNRQTWTETVREIAKKHGGKPILASEAGGPGFGQRYEECLAFFEQERVGFHLFEGMIGTNRFRNITGFFYPDGTVREIDPVKAFQALAQRQGVDASSEYKLNSSELPYLNLGVDGITNLILHWEEKELTAENYTRHESLLRWTFISLAWGGVLGDHIEHVQAVKRRADDALKNGDMAEVKKSTSELASLAAKLLIEHKFIDAADHP